MLYSLYYFLKTVFAIYLLRNVFFMFLNNTEESIQNISEMWRRILILPNFCLLLSELNVVCDKIFTC